MADGKTPLPSRAREALERIRPRVASAGAGLPRDRARSALVEGSFDGAEAEEALELLELRGYVYEVNGRLRVTEE